MIQQLVVQHLRAGCLQRYLQTLASDGLAPRERAGGRLEGVWRSAAGRLDEVWKLWSYPDAEALRRADDALRGDPAWQAGLLVSTLGLVRESWRRNLAALRPFEPARFTASRQCALVYRLDAGSGLPGAAAALAAPARGGHACWADDQLGAMVVELLDVDDDDAGLAAPLAHAAASAAVLEAAAPLRSVHCTLLLPATLARPVQPAAMR